MRVVQRSGHGDHVDGLRQGVPREEFVDTTWGDVAVVRPGTGGTGTRSRTICRARMPVEASCSVQAGTGLHDHHTVTDRLVGVAV